MLQNYSGEAYDEFLKDAAIDNRVGKHNAIVSKVEDGTWPSGDPRRKIQFSLLTAGNSKADLTWSPPPPLEELMKLKASQAKEDVSKKKAIAAAISVARQCAQHYGKAVTDIREGDQFRVETVKTRRDKETGTGGFIRVVALLAPQDSNGASPSSGPGF